MKEEFINELNDICQKYIKQILHSENMLARTSTRAYSIHSFYLKNGEEVNVREILDKISLNKS